jgi:hypothetical protein
MSRKETRGIATREYLMITVMITVKEGFHRNYYQDVH